MKPTSTCVEVSSADTTVASHLRETRSSTISTAIPALVKCVVGRTRARCRDYSRSVSVARPPHRTCAFPRIRRSTGSRWLCGYGLDG